jgi:SAM-dependent methyltransferase
METTKHGLAGEASLEKLIETDVLGVESLHPGGLELTSELAELCKIEKGTVVLDLASGTGESACFLSERFGAHVIGVDLSDQMLRRAEEKLRAKALNFVEFRKADASHLPFPDAAFDVVICECTLCFFDKEKVLGEMARVVKPGGRVGIHDLCWKESAPDDLRRTLSEIEGERPEALEGWSRLFREAGLIDIIAVGKSDLILAWMKNVKQQLGLIGQGVLALKIMRRWGFRGLWRVLQSERVFSSKHLGYGIVVGTRP